MEAKELKLIVKEKYGQIAERSSDEKSCGCGSSCCGPGVDYTVFSENYENKEGYNSEADLNLGCGIPTDYAGIKNGDHVLDLGSGAGNDCFVARALVGDKGKVTGIDMTEPMVKKAKENCLKLGYGNVEFFLGEIEDMPFDVNQFDVVISNCVLNLVPDKSKAFREIFRVLKSGARFCVSDVVVKGSLSEKMRKDAEMYAGCVSGASEMDEYLKIIQNTGFTEAIVHKKKEIILPDNLLAEYNDKDEVNSFNSEERGILSITVSARKPL